MSSLKKYVDSKKKPAQRRLFSATQIAFAVIVLALVGYIGWQTVPDLLPRSAEGRYVADKEKIELAVLGHRTGYPGKPLAGGGYGRRTLRSALGGDQAGRGLFFGLHPTFAEDRRGTKDALKQDDVTFDEITSLAGVAVNPVGGSRGGTPLWEDVDGDGVRNAASEKLFYEGASPTVDHWNTTTVVEFDGTAEFVVDSRDWFIDMVRLIEREFLDRLPASASPDNHPEGLGSYSWYIDEEGNVDSLLYGAPTPDSTGFRSVYP